MRQSPVPVADIENHPALEPRKRRLADEEQAYAEALAELDRLAGLAAPEEDAPALRELLAELNALWPAAQARSAPGLRGAVDRRAAGAMAPVVERQTRFNAVLVRLLNALLEAAARRRSHERDLAAALVRYAQRVEPVMDARDDERVARAPSRAEQLLEVFEERLRAQVERLEGLLALRDRVEALGEEVHALRGSLAAGAPPPELARAAVLAAEGSVYTAFENRFRGSREEIRARQERDVAVFEGLAPVVDLGCGRGEFLQALRARGLEARGVESNPNVARECREKGLDVVSGDLVAFLRDQGPGSLGGVFAAQVVEHLEPAVLQSLLAEAHRSLRPGGVLLLETVNAASAFAFLEVFIRDLTHERPLHPDTLRFLAAAAGFSDARIELRQPVPADVRLHLVPGGGLPPRVLQALNENVERLNALLFAPVDYALIARR
jgi:O-antigen chain-terminating methyltransferase